MISTLLGAGYLVCSALAYAINNADSWHSFPRLQNEAMARDDAAKSVFLAIAGPISLLVAYLSSGFAQYGLKWSIHDPQHRTENSYESAT